jgi:hypothetical protein
MNSITKLTDDFQLQGYESREGVKVGNLWPLPYS